MLNYIKKEEKMKKINYLFLCSALCAGYLNAQTEVDAEIRLRFEKFNNVNDKFYGENPKLGSSKDDYLLSRVRLGITHSFDDNFKAKVSIQDSRVFGWGFDDKDWYNREFGIQNNPQQDEIELSQTYLEYKVSGFKTTLGRQRIAYGDNRVFGPSEWKNSGKWVWDALKVSYKNGNNFIDVFYGGTMLHEPNQFSLNHRHGYMGAGVYGHYEYKKDAAFEPILAYKYNDDGNELYKDMRNYYFGFRAYDKNIMNIFYDMTYIKSTGEKTSLNSTKIDTDSYGYHAQLGYSFKDIATKVAFAYTYADEKFDAVFGASDKYYGRLNLFGWSNIKDYELYTVIKPIKGLKFKLEYHKFYADEPTSKWKSYTIASMKNDYYGDEVDLIANYKYSKNIGLLLGLSYFKAGDFIQEASTKNSFITDDNAYGMFTQFTYKY
jgi:hypothetical protein